MNAIATLPRPVLATHAADDLSKRYEFIDSHEVIERMAQEGYYVAAASVANPRRREALFAKHSIDFRHENAREINGAVPRILFVNSHDGSSSAQLLAGVYRFVCSNGLVVGHTVEQARIRHSGDAAAALIERVRGIARNTSGLYEKIDRWSKVDLSTEKARTFARYAGFLRFGADGMYSPEELLGVRREEDDAGNLWSVFNRVQENAVRGGLSGLTRTGRAATSRPLSDISRDVDFNSQLWTLAEEFAA